MSASRARKKRAVLAESGQSPKQIKAAQESIDKIAFEPEKTGEVCPQCGAEIVFEEGCLNCKNCGWSKCN